MNLPSLPGFVHKLRPAVKVRVRHLMEGGVLYDRNLTPLKHAATTDAGLYLTQAETPDRKGMFALFYQTGPYLFLWRQIAGLHFRRDSEIEIEKEPVNV